MTAGAVRPVRESDQMVPTSDQAMGMPGALEGAAGHRVLDIGTAPDTSRPGCVTGSATTR